MHTNEECLEDIKDGFVANVQETAGRGQVKKKSYPKSVK